MLILPIAIFQWRRAGSRGPSLSTPGCVHVRPTVRDDDGTFDPSCTTTAAAAAAAASTLRTRRRVLWRAVRGAWCRTRPSGPGRRVPSSRRHRRRRLCAARTEMAAQLGSSVAFAVLWAQLGSSEAFGSGCGQALPGVPRKAPLCQLNNGDGDVQTHDGPVDKANPPHCWDQRGETQKNNSS